MEGTHQVRHATLITALVAAGLVALSLVGCGSSDNAASEAQSQAEVASAASTSQDAAAAEPQDALPNGVYTADFNTDSTMFRANETKDGKGTLTVQNGRMTIHVALAGEGIVNVYPGTVDEATAEGAELLEPTTETVTYDDGTSEDVYAFDIPVPAIDQDFTVSIIGTQDKWYEHTVSVTNPVPQEQ